MAEESARPWSCSGGPETGRLAPRPMPISKRSEQEQIDDSWRCSEEKARNQDKPAAMKKVPGQQIKRRPASMPTTRAPLM